MTDLESISPVHPQPDRRAFLRETATGLVASAVIGSVRGLQAAPEGKPTAAAEPAKSPPKGKAESCIFVWLGGGAGQIDTWDPKRKGDPKGKKPGSYYNPIDTAITGVQVCEHLPKCAAMLDRFTIVRSIHHEVINEHAAAVNRVHTGRPTSGTIVYPSIGSVVAHERGAAADKIPAYSLIGYPNVTRGPGFLGAKYSYIYLTDTTSGPKGLSLPPGITTDRARRRESLLTDLRTEGSERLKHDELARDYEAAQNEALILAGPQFGRIFELGSEPAALREGYGGEFGQRCLLSRRLVEAGCRFVEVSHNLNFINGTGWDVHNDGIVNQHGLIRELDQALAALVADLEQKRLLDKTLIVVATEFGRPADFDGGGGRGHHAASYSMVLAGGGLKHCGAMGETDELGMKVIADPVSIPDFHATIYAALGINPHKELYAGDRPVPITDGGKVIAKLFDA